MTICNSCRYCEGLCAVFPAMEMRRAFGRGDLNYLANLCHGCGACYFDCQFSPPHEFDVNVPRVLAELRGDSYRNYVWPAALAPMFDRNGLAMSLMMALSVAVFILGFVAFQDSAVVFGIHSGPGAFYRLMPHNAIVTVLGVGFVYGLLALAVSLKAFWKEVTDSHPLEVRLASLLVAMRDAGQLRYLDGGGSGCQNESEKPTDRRKIYHHLTFYGFLLCFAATSVATLYHYLAGRLAPYPWWDLPVLLGTLGGIGLLIGPLGLLMAKRERVKELQDKPRLGMDVAFIAMLFLTSLTGLLLLVLRDTAAMGILLAIHLGVVFSLFVAMPYGKFVHGFYRYLALVRYAAERRQMSSH